MAFLDLVRLSLVLASFPFTQGSVRLQRHVRFLVRAAGQGALHVADVTVLGSSQFCPLRSVRSCFPSSLAVLLSCAVGQVVGGDGDVAEAALGGRGGGGGGYVQTRTSVGLDGLGGDGDERFFVAVDSAVLDGARRRDNVSMEMRTSS